MENMEKIGKRFVNIVKKLDKLGVFYGENYGGKYHEKYPHCSYWVELNLDKHRSGFDLVLYDNGTPEKSFGSSDRKDPAIMIIEALENGYEGIIKDLKEDAE